MNDAYPGGAAGHAPPQPVPCGPARGSRVASTRERLGTRRALVAFLAAALALGPLVLAWPVLAPGGWTVWEVLILFCLAAHAPWVGLTATSTLIGLVLRLRGPDPAAAVLPALRDPGVLSAPIRSRTLIALCVRAEDMSAVLPPAARLLRELQARHGGCFALGVLSDTPAGPGAEAEAASVAGLAARFPPGTVLYRRRADNIGTKGGNLMDFLDHHAAGFDHALVLDADSVMTAEAVLRLVRVMQVDPGLAILQATVAGHGAETGFARLFDRGLLRAARVWVTGQAWWQGPAQLWWGHNALIRIAAFRRDAQLPLLPGGAHILSHDYAEAARLHAAGWAVRVWPDERGSSERHPPDLPALFARDLRWAAGNLQYRHLLRRRDFGRLGRFQMLEAIMHYALAPLRLALLPLAALNVVTGGGAATPQGALLLLLGTGLALLSLPRLAGHAEALLRPGKASRVALVCDMGPELAFGLLLEPLEALERTLILLRLALGRFGGWAPQPRTARQVTWAAAARRFWPHTAFGLVLAAGFMAGSAPALLAALPALAGLLLAVPLAVWTARPLPSHGAADAVLPVRHLPAKLQRGSMRRITPSRLTRA